MKVTTVIVDRDRGWTGIRRRLDFVGRSSLEVGVFEGQTEDGFDLALLAAVQEFGNSNLPARSFIASTLRSNQTEIRRWFAVCGRAVFDKSADELQTLGLLGTWLAQQMQRRILAGQIEPPLKPETVARKGDSRPLVSTGRLVEAITHRVVQR